MQAHHQRAVEALTQRFRMDPECLALILVGSLATGREKGGSDVDFVAVVTDARFATLKAERMVHQLIFEACDYAGGYAEGKMVNLQFLLDAADHGSEPARWAFSGARILFSDIDNLAGILAAIPVYPQRDKAEKIARFYAQLKVWQGYLEYAERKGDAYIMHHSASRVALFAGRIVLAQNEILYPYHKWFMAAVTGAPQQPAGFAGQLQRFVERPTAATAEALRQGLDGWLNLEVNAADWISRFVMDSEWNWLGGLPSVEDA